MVGILFTAGCAIPTLIRATTETTAPLWPLLTTVTFFALIAWLNCHAIDRWESTADSTIRHSIFPIAAVLALAGLLLAAILPTGPRPAALLIAAAATALLLALLDKIRNHVTPITLRAAADLALLTSALLIPIAPIFK